MNLGLPYKVLGRELEMGEGAHCAVAPRLRENSRGAASLNLKVGGAHTNGSPDEARGPADCGAGSRGNPGADLRKEQPVLPAVTRVMGRRPEPWELGKGSNPSWRGLGQGRRGQAKPERDTDRVGQGGGMSGWGSYKHGSRRGLN